MKRILDKSFRYVPAAKTDIRRTFKRIRDQQRKEKEFAEHRITTILRRKAA